MIRLMLKIERSYEKRRETSDPTGVQTRLEDQQFFMSVEIENAALEKMLVCEACPDNKDSSHWQVCGIEIIGNADIEKALKGD